MTTKPRKKLIEVSIPLEPINAASAREKSIRHGHPKARIDDLLPWNFKSAIAAT
jgi:adenine-specific DNA methylase